MQVLRSPRRFRVAAMTAGALAIAAFVGLAGGGVGSLDQHPTTHAVSVLAAALSAAFLGYVTVRALLSRVELDEVGGRYVGLVRTIRWRWAQVRAVGRQRAYAFGSTGSSPALTLRRGREVVLVGLSDPGHPGAEDALIAALQAHLDAARAAAPPSPAQGIVDDLLRRDEDPGPAG